MSCDWNCPHCNAPDDERPEPTEDDLIEAIVSVQNFMQGVCFDPRVPEDVKQALRSKCDSMDWLVPDA